MLNYAELIVADVTGSCVLLGLTDGSECTR
jgi:hypothetical protein